MKFYSGLLQNKPFAMEYTKNILNTKWLHSIFL